MEGKRAATERQYNLVMAAAWYGAVIPLMKKIPLLNDMLILTDKPAAKAQTAADMASAMSAWASRSKAA